MIVELALSKPASGVSDEDVREATFAVAPILHKLPGLLYREVLSDMQGRWADLIYWETKEHADRAMPTVGHYPEVQDLFSKLDPAVEIFTLTPVHGRHITLPDLCVVELALFRTISDTDRSSFEQVVHSTWDVLSSQPGYLNREVLYAADGQWVDVVHWHTLEHAMAAMTVMDSHERMQPFVSKIDPASVRMLHLQRIHVYA
jgi:hypothetical protein